MSDLLSILHQQPGPVTAPADGAMPADTTAEALGALPVWRLDDLYAGADDPAIERDFAEAERVATDLAETYEGKLAGTDAAGLLRAITLSEEFGALAGRLMSFAGLRYYADTGNVEYGKFLGDCQTRITEISARTVFFTLELNRA